MHPILFQIGSFNFYTHGLCAVLGIFFGGYLIYFLHKKQSLDHNNLFDNIVLATLAGIVGARLAYYFLYSNQFNSSFELLYLWQGGMVSYGGFVVGGLVYYLLLKLQKQNVLKIMDMTTVGFFFGMFFGRIGNIMAGEYSGVNVNSALSINGVFPAPVYEGLLCLIIAIVGYAIINRNKSKVSGFVFCLSFMVYGFVRFVIDYWRVEDKIFSIFSIGQITDLIVFVVFLIGLIILNKRGKNELR